VRGAITPDSDDKKSAGFKAHTVSIEVTDTPGVLNEVTGVIARRGYNIQSLAVGNSEKPGCSRITTVLPGQEGGVSKLIKQIEKLVVVIGVKDLTDLPHVARELVLVKVCLFRFMIQEGFLSK
jgi:acetolactate synthase-1/3 small subunit